MERNEKMAYINNSTHNISTAIADNNAGITNCSEDANVFNNCFSKVAIDIQSSISFSNKNYHDYLLLLDIEPFFIF